MNRESISENTNKPPLVTAFIFIFPQTSSSVNPLTKNGEQKCLSAVGAFVSTGSSLRPEEVRALCIDETAGSREKTLTLLLQRR